MNLFGGFISPFSLQTKGNLPVCGFPFFYVKSTTKEGMSNTLRQCRKSPIGINPDAEHMSRRKFHRLNPEMIMELKEEGIYRPNFPCNNSHYTPNKNKN